jgi:trans-aconitate methyltransferase
MTSLRERLLSTVAGQLGRPHGILSPLVARVLNRGNERLIATVADIGFGGAVGLQLLLARVGDDGVVHGVEIADDMLRRARSKFGSDVRSGRLRLPTAR